VNSLRPAVFLDRDGVLNRAIIRDGKPYSPMTPAEFQLLPGVQEACLLLEEQGLPLIVVTNQPEIARGRLPVATVTEMHAELRRKLPILDVVVCGHDNADNCACRKPKPGMILDAAQRHGLDPARSVMVGDRGSDIAAGLAAGCATVRVGGGYSGEALGSKADAEADSLKSALDLIIQLIK
jgi:D-glycero-D-manno-heptose 1,7-bisphosphate phosphatase